MKTFNTFKDAFNWVEDILQKTTKEALPIITEQLYKDSDKYTFRDTGAMYDTGAMNSDFDNGIIIERAPQVRMLYYNPNVVARGNKMAIPQWLEVTAKENMNTYKNIYIKIQNQNKR
jgi:hypothetical protein